MEQKPWLRHYDPGVPTTLTPYPDLTLLDVLAETVRLRPQHPTLLFKGASMSAATLDQLSTDLAAALVSQGVKRGDRVALALPNCPQTVIGQLAAWKAGAIAVLMNPLYPANDLRLFLAESGAGAAIVLTPFYDKIKSVQAETGLRLVIATGIKDYLPPHLKLLFTIFKEKKEGHRIALKAGDLRWSDLLRRHAGSPPQDISPTPDDACILLFSGGTTGIPKATAGSHRALFISATQLHAWFSVILKDWDDVIMQILPLFHVYGNVATMATAFVGRNPLSLVPNPRDLGDVIATIGKTRPAFLPAVPTLFIGLLNHPDVKAGKVDFRSMKLCISGAAPLLTETKKSFEAVTGGRLLEGYGLTESMMAAVINPVNGPYKPGSIGLPVTDVEVRIADPTTGEGNLPLGETGEILMKAPQLMLGYWGHPEETAEALKDGWLHTGDLGHMDEDGFIFITDRKKDLIKAGGFQVWPREIEEVIATHPAVAEVCCGGIPDPYRGETIKAWIVLKKGLHATAEEIQAFCRERMAAYKVPSAVEFRESLPKTMVGKVLRRALVEEEKQRMKENAI